MFTYVLGQFFNYWKWGGFLSLEGLPQVLCAASIVLPQEDNFEDFLSSLKMTNVLQTIRFKLLTCSDMAAVGLEGAVLMAQLPAGATGGFVEC